MIKLGVNKLPSSIDPILVNICTKGFGAEEKITLFVHRSGH